MGVAPHVTASLREEHLFSLCEKMNLSLRLHFPLRNKKKAGEFSSPAF